MSNGNSKFGMLRNLQQASAPEAEAEKQKSAKTEKQEAAKPEKRQKALALKQQAAEAEKQNAITNALPETIELKHYSSYMPMPLFAQLQIFVAKKKAARGNSGDKVSLQSVIAEAIEQYLQKYDV